MFKIPHKQSVKVLPLLGSQVVRVRAIENHFEDFSEGLECLANLPLRDFRHG
jgi:hypothetical protein